MLALHLTARSHRRGLRAIVGLVVVFLPLLAVTRGVIWRRRRPRRASTPDWQMGGKEIWLGEVPACWLYDCFLRTHMGLKAD